MRKLLWCNSSIFQGFNWEQLSGSWCKIPKKNSIYKHNLKTKFYFVNQENGIRQFWDQSVPNNVVNHDHNPMFDDSIRCKKKLDIDSIQMLILR